MSINQVFQKAGTRYDLEAMYTEMTKGYVYFIQETTSKHIKIGYTASAPEKRLTALQIGNPNKLVLLGWLWGNKDVESYLHAQFRHSRIAGEWFEASEELLDLIKEKNCAGN